MKLKSFRVVNFRSISDAQVSLGDYTVLIGPNNEGKSNILTALVLALNTVKARGVQARTLVRYDEERDVPVGTNASTELTMKFQLDSSDRAEFSKVVGSSLSGDLTLKLTYARGLPSFEVIIQGPAKRRLTSRRLQIGEFLAKRIDIVYVAAHRTAADARRVVTDIMKKELEVLRGNAKYEAALAELRRLEQPILDGLAARVVGTLREFLPDVRGVELGIGEEITRRHEAVEIVIDDGAKTALEQKGDGAQSLAALALIRDSRRTNWQGALVLAVEEPESHLHADAVHRLRKVLLDVSRTHQVIITTHSGLLVDRSRVASAMIVKRNSFVSPARSLAQIRTALGIRGADNLVSANLVLLVEGSGDALVLRSWLARLPDMGKALSDGVLAIEDLGGASKLTFKADQYRNHLLCNVHAFLDADAEGNAAVASAKAAGVLEDNEYQQAICPGMRESELEDLFEMNIYADEVLRTFGVDLRRCSAATQMSPKWSDRMSQCFREQGRNLDHDGLTKLKTVVAQAACVSIAVAIRPERVGALEALLASLRSRL